ncbi:hypothetical protein HMI54_006051, partial [Coelomomyces lativittatus]
MHFYIVLIFIHCILQVTWVQPSPMDTSGSMQPSKSGRKSRYTPDELERTEVADDNYDSENLPASLAPKKKKGALHKLRKELGLAKSKTTSGSTPHTVVLDPTKLEKESVEVPKDPSLKKKKKGPIHKIRKELGLAKSRTTPTPVTHPEENVQTQMVTPSNPFLLDNAKTKMDVNAYPEPGNVVNNQI